MNKLSFFNLNENYESPDQMDNATKTKVAYPLYEDNDTKYFDVVFLQGDKATEAFSVLETQGLEALLEYLKQFEAESDGDMNDTPMSGNKDTVKKIDDYIITYNKDLGYIGLEKIINNITNEYYDETGTSIPYGEDSGVDPEAVHKEKIPGGLAKDMSLLDLAKKHDVDVSLIVKGLKKGINVEMEHTDSKEVAEEIAMDHLYEDPFYYDKLAKIEEDQAEKKGIIKAFYLRDDGYGNGIYKAGDKFYLNVNNDMFELLDGSVKGEQVFNVMPVDNSRLNETDISKNINIMNIINGWSKL